MSIIATRQDLDSISMTDPSEHARFIALLRASLVTRTDICEYPEGYDHTLAPDATGYLAPIFEDRSTPELAARFGFAPEGLAEVGRMLGLADALV